MSQQVSTQVDTLADTVLAAYRQQQQQVQKRAQHREQSLRERGGQQVIAVLQTLLSTELEPELLSALAFSYEVNHRGERTDPPAASAVLNYAGIVWYLSQEFTGRSGEWHWNIHACGPGYDTAN